MSTVHSTYPAPTRPSCCLTALPVVPSEDSHQSEYIAPCDARRGQPSPTTAPLRTY